MPRSTPSPRPRGRRRHRGPGGNGGRAARRARSRRRSGRAASSVERDPLGRQVDLLLPVEARVEVDPHGARVCVDTRDRPRGRRALAEEDPEGREPGKVDPHPRARHVGRRADEGHRCGRRSRRRRPLELGAPVEIRVVGLRALALLAPALAVLVLFVPVGLVLFVPVGLLLAGLAASLAPPLVGPVLVFCFLVFPGVVANRVDRLLDLVLGQPFLDRLHELVLLAQAQLAQQLLLRALSSSRSFEISSFFSREPSSSTSSALVDCALNSSTRSDLVSDAIIRSFVRGAGKIPGGRDPKRDASVRRAWRTRSTWVAPGCRTRRPDGWPLEEDLAVDDATRAATSASYTAGDPAGKQPSARASQRRPSLRDDGASRTRTGDLLGAIQALSQLSYSPAAAQCS